MSLSQVMQRIAWGNLSIGVKLSLSFAAVMLVFMLAAVFQHSRITEIELRMSEVQDRTNKYQNAEQLRQYTMEISLLRGNLMVFGDARATDRFIELRELIQPLVARIAESASTKEQRMWRNQLLVSSEEYLQFFEQALQVMDDASLTEEQRQDRLMKLHSMSEIHKDYILQVIDQFVQVYNLDAADAEEQMLRSMEEASIASFLMPAISTMLAIMFTAWFIIGIRRPIRRLQNAVQAIAEGDLRHQIKVRGDDEFGSLSRYFNRMIDRVSHMLGSTQGAAVSLYDHAESFLQFSQATAEANGMIVHAMKEIAAGAHRQAELTEDSAAQTVDMRMVLNSMHDNAAEMNDHSLEAMNWCEAGAREVEGLLQSAEQTERIFDQLSTSMEQLAEQTRKIAKMTSSISEFAEQTNILAINAAIVAAHAGQEGRGFTVIAAQIRELADRSKQATVSIHGLIGSLQSQMQDVSDNMGKVRSAMDYQLSKVGGTQHTFEQIRQAMTIMHHQVAGIHLQITKAQEIQDRIAAALQTMSGITEETAAGAREINSNAEVQHLSVQQIAEQAEEINRLSEQLIREIHRFKIAA